MSTCDRVAPETSAAADCAAEAAAALRRLRAVVLLGGTLRPTDLSSGIDRSMLDLPAAEGQSLLGLWCRQVQALRQHAGLDELPIRLLINDGAPEPRSVTASLPGVPLSVERDPFEFRGTGGVLRDITLTLDEADYVLVANAGQVMTDALAAVTHAAAALGCDACVVVHDDGTPSGVMLLRAGCLRQIADVGFVDMKEQALPQLASRFDVRVLRRHAATGLPVRTMAGYLAALRAYHRNGAAGHGTRAAFAEDWQPTFALVEPGATVADDAYLHDSVVLAGATVERGATVVRSVVCPEATVRADTVVVDQLVTRGRRG